MSRPVAPHTELSDWLCDFQAMIEGDLRVSYYDTEAGLKTIQAQAVPARSWPSVIKVCLKPHQDMDMCYF